MKNFFGTDGIRGKVGLGLLTQEKLISLGSAIGTWATSKYSSPRIILAYDTRESSPQIKLDLLKGILKKRVTLFDAGILPTPAICSSILHTKKFDCGIVITASHNPYHDNGIKIFDYINTKLSIEDELYISSLIENETISSNEQGSYHTYFDAKENYIDKILTYFASGFLSSKKIVLDVANGSAFQVYPEIFTRLGAETKVIHNLPNGRNINDNCGSVYPQKLQESVINHEADIGFAFDGDGDRVIAVNKHGCVKDGDDFLALLSRSQRYLHEKHIIGTVMSNEGLANHIKKQNKKFIRSDVGDRNVGQKLTEFNSIVGGESSGHIILQDHLPTGDGIFTALRIMESIIESENWSFETFKKFPQEQINIPIIEKKDLNQEPFYGLIKKAENNLHSGRILVRYSGTQNLLRIMVEDKNKEKTKEIAYQLASKLKEAFNDSKNI